MKLVSALESLLFVVGEDGISLKDIMDILDVNEEKAEELVCKIKNEYAKDEHGII